MSFRTNLRSNFSVLLASFRMRMMTITRYPGQLISDIVIPIVFAYMPILLGRASSANPAATFEANTGTSNYIAYMLIGSSVFTLVNFAFWHVAYWLRWEQEAGTLEALYLAPTHRIWVVAGTALYSCLRGIFSALAAYLLGSLILNVNPFQGEVLLALVFILVGLIPLYSLTLLYGALVLKVKEANALVNLMQWGVSFFMGIFFPITIFPPLLKVIALLFPPTWMTNGVRSALLGVGFFFKAWYLDLAVLWAFVLVTPFLGYWIFNRTEISVRRNEGVGQF
ncbi:MAG TPA: ABC transporter permease [Anaerolineales bacterium]